MSSNSQNIATFIGKWVGQIVSFVVISMGTTYVGLICLKYIGAI